MTDDAPDKNHTIERIPKEVLDPWRAELSEWTTPAAFRERIDELSRSIPRRTFFKQAGLAFLRDAWIASRVAVAMSSESVRLISDDRPDFEIRKVGTIDRFEATEADMDDRRRGDEPDFPGLHQDAVEDWRKRFEAIRPALDRVVSKKLKKDYPPDVRLVIYVNLSCYGAYLDEGLPILRSGTSAAKDKFKIVFVMWEGTLYKMWECGQPAAGKWSYTLADDF
jgi:hypothetical protein